MDSLEYLRPATSAIALNTVLAKMELVPMPLPVGRMENVSTSNPPPTVCIIWSASVSVGTGLSSTPDGRGLAPDRSVARHEDGVMISDTDTNPKLMSADLTNAPLAPG